LTLSLGQQEGLGSLKVNNSHKNAQYFITSNISYQFNQFSTVQVISMQLLIQKDPFWDPTLLVITLKKATA